MPLGDESLEEAVNRAVLREVLDGVLLRDAALLDHHGADALERCVHLGHVGVDRVGQVRDALHREADRAQELNDLGAALFVLRETFGIGVVLFELGELLGAALEDRNGALAHFLELFARHGRGPDVGRRIVRLGVDFSLVDVGVGEAVHHGVDAHFAVLEDFGVVEQLAHGHRILQKRRHELAREHFDRLGDFDFALTRQKFVAPHAAQIGAQGILREPRRLFGREHHFDFVFVEVVAVVEAAVGDEVVGIGRRVKDLNAEAHEPFGHFLQVLFRTEGFFGEVVVDFLDRHPAAAAAETNERAVAVAGVLLAGAVHHGGAGFLGFAEILFGGVRTSFPVGLIVLPVGLRQLFPFEPLFLERFLLVEVDVGIKSVVTRLHQSISFWFKRAECVAGFGRLTCFFSMATWHARRKRLRMAGSHPSAALRVVRWVG